MREIKFRGQGIVSGNWYFGYYVYRGNHHCIIEEDGTIVKVDPETVGQYTGRKDKEGQEIYEGDIAKLNYSSIGFRHGIKGAIEFNKGAYLFNSENTQFKRLLEDCNDIKLIGNIY